MRRICRSGGFYITLAGVIILLLGIMPCKLWWLVIGLALVIVGLLIGRC
ncbi:MAG TPA: hypothetical protein GXZ77_01600 [Papillibacter sp.]|jgi:hypothetical protein|nr:hypothetical protein [Papillibacter sp.]